MQVECQEHIITKLAVDAINNVFNADYNKQGDPAVKYTIVKIPSELRLKNKSIDDLMNKFSRVWYYVYYWHGSISMETIRNIQLICDRVISDLKAVKLSKQNSIITEIKNIIK